MKITYKQLVSAVEQKIVTTTQAEQLWAFWQAQNKNLPTFKLTHVLYYLGGMIAIGAMSLFMNLGWERLGGIGLLCICVIYAIIAFSLGEFLLRRYDLVIPATVLITLVTVLTPLAVYALEQVIGFWDTDYFYQNYYQHNILCRLIMEIATIVVSICLIYRYRFPFLFLPLASALWCMSLDLTLYLFDLLGYLREGFDYANYSTIREYVSLLFGLFITGIAFVIDLKNKTVKDFSFWLYLSGVITFWGALSSMYSDSELAKFCYCCINLLMILIGATIARKVFVVFGALGITGYLAHLAYDVFEDSLLFPLVLTLIGLFIIFIGIIWQCHEKAINHYLLQFLPQGLKNSIQFRKY